MKFDYIYGNQTEQYDFIRIPRLLLAGSEFSAVSVEAKLLYGMLLDKMGQARKNDWFDQMNRVYIVYPLAEIQHNMSITKKKAMALMNELEQFRLIERVKRGNGLPSIIYVMKIEFVSEQLKDRSALIGTSAR